MGKLLCWKDAPKNNFVHQQREIEKLRDEATKLLQNKGVDSKSNSAMKVKKSKIRPVTAVSKNSTAALKQRTFSAQSRETTSRKQRVESANSNSRTRFGGDNVSRHYLKIARQKQEELDKALALTIDKGKRESEFDCLHKMGEANDIAKSMGLRMEFSASKDGDELLIH